VPNSCRPERELPDGNLQRGKEGTPNFHSAKPARSRRMQKLN